jgi:hypothetical protein
MKSRVLAAMTVTLGLAAAAVSNDSHAQHVTIRVDTPEFGIRIGHPAYRPAPVFAPPPVYVPAPPVYIPPPVVHYPAVYPVPVYGPPRVIYTPPPVVVYPHPGRGHRHGHHHHHRHHDGHGFDRDDHDDRFRHGGYDGRVIQDVRVRTH